MGLYEDDLGDNRKRNLRVILIMIIVATIPFYCIGFGLLIINWGTAPQIPGEQQLTPSATPLGENGEPASPQPTLTSLPTGVPATNTPIGQQPPIVQPTFVQPTSLPPPTVQPFPPTATNNPIPLPSNTPIPSSTPLPPPPTATPFPTNTPIPPTAAPTDTPLPFDPLEGGDGGS